MVGLGEESKVLRPKGQRVGRPRLRDNNFDRQKQRVSGWVDEDFERE